MGQRAARVLRWLALPWRPALSACLLVVALSLPVAFATAGGAVATSAADDVTAAVVGRTAAETLTLELRSRSQVVEEPDGLDGALAALDRATTRVRGPLGGDAAVHDRWLSTSLQLRARAPDGPQVGLRLVATDGATAGLGDEAGIWLPSAVADELDVEAGDPLELTELAERGRTTVAGVFDAHEVADVPADLRPSTTGTATPIAWGTPRDLLATGLPLEARFRARPLEVPTTREELSRLVDEVASARTAAGADGPLRFALTVLAAGEDPRVRVDTGRAQLDREVSGALGAAEGPLRLGDQAARLVALALALAGTTSAVRRQRHVVRLVVDDGTPPLLVALVGGLLGVLPVVVAAALGLAGGHLLTLTLVDVPFTPPPMSQVLTIVGLLLGAAAVLTWRTARRTDDGDDGLARLRPALVTGLVVASAASGAWLLTARAGSDLPSAALVFPMATLGAVAVLGVGLFGVITRNLPERGGRLDARVLLAWRRLAAPRTGASAATSALAAAVGLVVFAGVLVPTLRHASEVSTSLRLGGEAVLDTGRTAVGIDPADVPASAAVVASEGRTIAGRRGTVVVQVVQPERWADVVTWHREYAAGGFGDDPGEVADALGHGTEGDALAVVAVGPLPDDGVVDLGGGVPFTVVGRLRAAPLMSVGRPTLLVSSGQLEAAGRAAWRRRALSIADTVDQAVEGGLAPYRSPVDRFSTRVVGDVAALQQVVARAELPRSAELLTDVAPTARAARLGRDLALRFLLAVAVVVLGAALLSLGLFLAERRRRNRTADLMLAAMGMSTTARRTSLAIELFVVVGLVVAIGAVAGLGLVRVVAQLLSPDTALPVPLGPRVPIGLLAALLVGWPVVSLAGAVLGASRRAGGRGEVLRGAV